MGRIWPKIVADNAGDLRNAGKLERGSSKTVLKSNDKQPIFVNLYILVVAPLLVIIRVSSLLISKNRLEARVVNSKMR